MYPRPRVGHTRRCLAILSVIFAAHCSGSQPATPSPVAQALSITGDRPLVEGETTTLIATGKWSDGSSRAVTDGVSWASDDPSIASVSSQGVVLGRAAGTTRIRATFNGLSAVSPLSVTAGTRRVNGRVHESAPTEGVNVAGAVIAAIDASGTAFSATADAAGGFALDMRPGTARITVTAAGYEPAQSTVEIGPAGATLSLALVPEYRETRISFSEGASTDMVRQRAYRLDVHHNGVIDARYIATYQSASAQAMTCIEVRDGASVLAHSQGVYDGWAPDLRLNAIAGHSYEVKFFMCEPFVPASGLLSLTGWGGEIKFPR